MGVVEPCVGAFGQLPDPLSCRCVRGRRRPPPPVAVSWELLSFLDPPSVAFQCLIRQLQEHNPL